MRRSAHSVPKSANFYRSYRMSDITIRRQHGKSLAEARAAAEHMAAELDDEFDLKYTWNGDRLRFKRPTLAVSCCSTTRRSLSTSAWESCCSQSSPPSSAQSTGTSTRTSRSEQNRPLVEPLAQAACNFSTRAIYCCIASSDPVPLIAAQASYLARPTRSVKPGRRPSTSPSVDCLYSA